MFKHLLLTLTLALAASGLSPLLAQEPLYAVTGEQPDQQFGCYIRRLHDVDGDARSDFAVSLGDELRVFSGRSGNRLYEIRFSPDEIVTEFAGLEDVNGDGAGDLALNFGARIEIRSGVDGQQIRSLDPATYGGIHGFEDVIDLGDMNSDGAGDLAVFLRDDSAKGYADFYALSGADGSLLYRIDRIFVRLIFFERTTAVDLIEDLDGDGVQDLVATMFTSASSNLAFFSGIDGSVIREVPMDGLEQARAAGDLNGDGFPDVWLKNSSLAPPVIAAVSAADLSVIHYIEAETSGAVSYLETPVDVNGDGFRDLLLGGYLFNVGDNGRDGFVQMYSGKTGKRLYTEHAPVADYGIDGFNGGIGFGECLGLDDMDDDGRAEIAVAAPGANLGGMPDVGALFVLKGNDLYLDASQIILQSGEPLQLESGESTPGSLAAIVLYANAWTYTRVMTWGALDADGHWVVNAVVPHGLEGFEFYLQSFVLDGATVRASAMERLRVE